MCIECEPYKGNQVHQIGVNSFIGYYYNADGEINETKVCPAYCLVCEELDKYACEMDIANPDWQ